MSDKYPILRPNEIISALSKKGFIFKSQKGSHAKYTNGYRTIVIPMHNTVARGTLKSILVQAGMELEEFLKLL
ncbi:MAG: type II toxin-antitoxin system HicA family toxin [Planctomycetaceae bacterium]|jgi:predicted RNA binding protein YcfA (HicA-like mRNA interferase family)|nr:type II toxin-antitoxin system HicA family toxin [Planctomycetaceae bacterium]